MELTKKGLNSGYDNQISSKSKCSNIKCKLIEMKFKRKVLLLSKLNIIMSDIMRYIISHTFLFIINFKEAPINFSHNIDTLNNKQRIYSFQTITNVY